MASSSFPSHNSTAAATVLALLAALLAVGVAGASVAGTRGAVEAAADDETWAEEYNLVEPPPASGALFAKYFDGPQPKGAASRGASLKTIIKALYRLDAFQKERIGGTAQTEAATTTEVSTAGEDGTTVPPPSSELLPPQEPQENDDAASETESATQKLGILLEDLVDSIVHLPAHMEADRTDKFTHSIRYGYGVPFHPKGL